MEKLKLDNQGKRKIFRVIAQHYFTEAMSED